MRIGCSGQVAGRSGIGVLQEHLYAYLADAGHELVFSKPRDVGTSPADRMRGLTRGFRPARGPVDVYLSTVPPLPSGIHAPLLTVVHDLRWVRTRSKIGATYRAWDLHRTVRRSDALVCVSENTRRDLIEFDPKASDKAIVRPLGPGLVPEGSFQQSNSGLVMLVGSATHKRNELAAAALALAPPPWARGVIGVGVSEQVRLTLSRVLPCEWFQNVSDAEMLALYQRAEYFLMLGTDEGFGLPFIEALAAGCQVIATDHLLLREVVGAAGRLITSGNPAEVGRQLPSAPTVPAGMRADHAKQFSWKVFGEGCEADLLRVAEDSGRIRRGDGGRRFRGCNDQSASAMKCGWRSGVNLYA
ncbi:glycosyltransferase [Mycolicibacterium sp. P9-64]|uniref:glycosyltransferase n=1 Tax=Mycolicibacterium sp. P9-64 TaxID=2024612 RepID=UPI0011EBFDE0|nr:glycosyltransferase [Mycolicibacterium sp. P9-64]KAA0079111.1 glycosyltransferase [Mycolicibacterium sp. P9-64]